MPPAALHRTLPPTLLLHDRKPSALVDFMRLMASVHDAVARAGVEITRTSLGARKCRHGFRKSKAGNSRCLPCKANTYQPKLGQSSCLTCKAPCRVNAAETTCSGAAFPMLLHHVAPLLLAGRVTLFGLTRT